MSEDKLGMNFVQDCVGIVGANVCTQRDTIMRGVEWRRTCEEVCVYYLVTSDMLCE